GQFTRRALYFSVVLFSVLTTPLPLTLFTLIRLQPAVPITAIQISIHIFMSLFLFSLGVVADFFSNLTRANLVAAAPGSLSGVSADNFNSFTKGKFTFLRTSVQLISATFPRSSRIVE